MHLLLAVLGVLVLLVGVEHFLADAALDHGHSLLPLLLVLSLPLYGNLPEKPVQLSLFLHLAHGRYDLQHVNWLSCSL